MDAARYSGRKSKKFWKRINAIKDQHVHAAAYGLGCELQNAERSILKAIAALLRADERDE